MKQILLIDASIQGEESVTRSLIRHFRGEVRRLLPQSEIQYLDLASSPPPHITGDMVTAYYTPPEMRTPHQKSLLAESDTYIEILRWADFIVMGLPMYNFGVPSHVKAWIDHIVRVGETFRFLEDGGYEGLLSGKQGLILSASSGTYSGDAPAAFLEHQVSYLKNLMGFIGIAEWDLIRAEGYGSDEDAKRRILSDTMEALDGWFSKL